MTECDQLKASLMYRIEDVFSSRPTWSRTGWDVTTLEAIQQIVHDEVAKHEYRVALHKKSNDNHIHDNRSTASKAQTT